MMLIRYLIILFLSLGPSVIWGQTEVVNSDSEVADLLPIQASESKDAAPATAPGEELIVESPEEKPPPKERSEQAESQLDKARLSRELRLKRLRDRAQRLTAETKKTMATKSIHQTARANKRKKRSKQAASFNLPNPTLKTSEADIEGLLDELASEISNEFIEEKTLLDDIAQIKADLEEAKAALKPIIEVDSVIQKIEFIKNEELAQQSEMRLDSGEIFNGDQLFISLYCRNKGPTFSDNVVVTYPIPPNTSYLGNVSISEDERLLYSVDGGYFFAPLEDLVDDSKELGLKTPGETGVTHLRWIHSLPLEVEEERILTFKAIVK